MGQYDVPAALDYITRVTGFQKVAYIGHSQGTTQMFTGLADYEETYYADKLSVFIALGPVTMVPNTEIAQLHTAVDHYDAIENVVNLFGVDSLLTGGLGSKKEDGHYVTICTRFEWLCKASSSLTSKSDEISMTTHDDP